MNWKIGNVEIANRVVLAPMAGYSNSAFRRIIKSMGCGLIYAEMVSDKAIYYKDKKTIERWIYLEDNHDKLYPYSIEFPQKEFVKQILRQFESECTD